MATILGAMRLYSRLHLLRAAAESLYVSGVTGNLQKKRVFQHKWKEYEGFSAKYNCDRLVWHENYQSRTGDRAAAK